MEDTPKINRALGYEMLIQLIENNPRYRELEETIIENIETGHFVTYFNVYEDIVEIIDSLETTLDPHIAAQMVAKILLDRFSEEKVNISLTPESLLKVCFQESLLEQMKEQMNLRKEWILENIHLERIKF